MSNPRLKDIPRLSRDASNLDAVMAAVQETLQTFRGYRGDALDRALTLRDLDETSRSIVLGGGYVSGTTGAGSVGPAGPPGPPGTITPDPTPPPTATGLAVTAGLSYIYVSCDTQTYTQGHGHGVTVVYGAKWPSGAAPTFASAVELFQFSGTFDAYPTDTGTRWCIWIKWRSNDGYLSTDPAGGTNGVQATTGKVGTSDLGALVVLAGNLAPGSVTADKAALDIGGENLLGNNSFEIDSNADTLADGWNVYNNSPGTEPATAALVAGRISGLAQRVSWTVPNSTTKGVATVSNMRGGGWQPNKTYVVSWYARVGVATNVGMQMAWNIQPATSVALKNPGLTTSWQRYAFRITWGASVEALGRMFLSITDASTGYIEFDDAQVEEGDTLSGYFGKLATNTIVAGDGAIANLAITNALIGNLAVDDAKVANLSVAKLTGATMQVGSYIQSTNYTSGAGGAGFRINADGTAELQAAYIRGLLTAAQIDTRGLDIKDPAGNVILAAGSSLDFYKRFGGIAGLPSSSLVLVQRVGTYHSIAGNTVRAPSGGGFSGAASSLQRYTGGCACSFRFENSGAYFIVGLNNNPNGDITNENYSFIQRGDNTVSIRERGVGEIFVTTGAAGDLFSIEYDGSYVYYRQNGVLIRGPVSAAGGQALYFTASVVDASYAIKDITFTPYGNPSAIQPTNPITGGNVSTYIANAAIGDAQIGNLAANKITTGTLDAARIAAGSLDANKITAGTITADRIVVGAVSDGSSVGYSGTIFTPFAGQTISSGAVDVMTLARVATNSFCLGSLDGHLTVRLSSGFGGNPAGNYVLNATLSMRMFNSSTGVEITLCNIRHNCRYFMNAIDQIEIPISMFGATPRLGATGNVTLRYSLTVAVLQPPISGGALMTNILQDAYLNATGRIIEMKV